MSNKPWRKTRYEVSYFVNARQKTYLHSTEIYLPNNPYEKLEEGYEPTTTAEQLPAAVPTSEEDKQERSRRRTYTAVKDIALSNEFEMFVTFTFKDNRFDEEKTRQKMVSWIKRQRKQDKSFQYLIVSELHRRCEECVDSNIWPCLHDDRIKAMHYHALIKGYKGKVVRAYWAKTGRPRVKKGRKVYDFPTFTLGHSEVYYIGNTEEDRVKSGFYLLKYIKKEMTTFKGKKRYWASRGLNKPITIENPDQWFFDVEPDHIFESDYGKFLFFDNKRIEKHLP